MAFRGVGVHFSGTAHYESEAFVHSLLHFTGLLRIIPELTFIT